MKHVISLLGLLSWAACGHAPAPSSRMPSATERAEEPSILSLRMQGIAADLTAEGFTDVGLSARGFLPPGERRTERLEVPAHTCFVFVGLGSAGITDLDLALYTPEGAVVVDDDKADARPVLSACNGGEPRTLYLRLLAYQGGGSFLTAMFVRPLRPEDSALAFSAPVANDVLFELSRTLNKRGFVERSDPLTLTLGEAQELRVATPSEAGHCYAALVEPSGGLVSLALRVVDDRGEELANGVIDRAASGLQWCARKTADAALVIRAQQGGGALRLLRFSGNEAVIGGASALWLGEPTPSDALWAAKSSASVRDKSAANAIEKKGVLSQGRMVDFALPKGARDCEEYEVTFTRGVAHAALSIVSDAGQVLASAEGGPPTLSVRTCKREQPAHLTLVSREGFGPFHLTGRADKSP